MPNDPQYGPHFIVRGERRDIHGQTVSKNSRGKDATEAAKGLFDLTDEEGAVWRQYGCDAKALCRLILRYREREAIFLRTAPQVVIDLVDLAVTREMP